MPFTFMRTKIPDVLIVEPKIFSDGRGFFFENYKRSDFENNGIDADFVQDNSSYSEAGVVRGMHFQSPPYDQGKLIRAVTGRILDVAIDIRVGSPFFGKWVSEELSEQNRKMLWVPSGFAHGFLSIEECYVHYKVTNEYNKDSEGGVSWDDQIIGINWGAREVALSPKDENWPTLEELKSPFVYCGK